MITLYLCMYVNIMKTRFMHTLKVHLLAVNVFRHLVQRHVTFLRRFHYGNTTPIDRYTNCSWHLRQVFALIQNLKSRSEDTTQFPTRDYSSSILYITAHPQHVKV